MNNIQQLRPQAALMPPRARPLRELMDATTKPREALLGEWKRQGHLCMVYAPTGVGKSFFAMSCAIAIAGGGEAFGWKAPECRRVLLVDGEMDREDITDRARVLIHAAPGVDAATVGENLYVMAYQDQAVNTFFPNIAEQAGQDCVVEMAQSTNAALVILDNFSTLAQVEDENAASAIDPLVELLRRLKRIGCAVILVHHSKKGPKGQDGSYRGSSKIAVTFQSIIRLSAPDDHDLAHGVAFTMKFEKVRGLRTAEHAARRAHLPAPSQAGQVGPAWTITQDEDPTLRRMVTLVRSRQYPTQADLAAAMEISTGLTSELKRKALASELISLDDWKRCMSEARSITEDDAADSKPF